MNTTQQFWIMNRSPAGPFSFAQVRSMFSGGQLTLQDQFARSEGGPWASFLTIADELIAAQDAAQPPAPMPESSKAGPLFSQKGCAFIIGFVTLILLWWLL